MTPPKHFVPRYASIKGESSNDCVGGVRKRRSTSEKGFRIIKGESSNDCVGGGVLYSVVTWYTSVQ